MKVLFPFKLSSLFIELPGRFAFISYLLIVFLFTTCNNISKDKPPPTSSLSENAPTLTVSSINALLSDEPGFNAANSIVLSKGEQLTGPDSISTFTSELTLNGQKLNLPWVKVKTLKGKEGWVFSGFINGLEDQLLEQQMSNIQPAFISSEKNGKIIQLIDKFNENWYSIDSTQNLYKLYLLILEAQAILNTRKTPTEDLLNISKTFPPLVLERINEQPSYHFFINYGLLLEKAKSTKDISDDHFFTIQTMIFQQDSIEYFYPAWKIPQTEELVHSLLGKGLHYSLFVKIDSFLAIDTLFSPLYKKVVNELVEDITNPKTTYWENIQNINGELDQILSASLHNALNPNDLVSLKTRRKQFEEFEKHQIKVNFRSGLIQN